MSEEMASITSSFKVLHYMFCHPEHVILRKHKKRVLNWKHLMPTSELCLSLKQDSDYDIKALHVSQGSQILEELSPFHKFATRSMTVTLMDNWIAFKWITRKGITQFQCELQSPKIAQHVATKISKCKIRVVQKSANNDAENRLVPAETQQICDSQNTQVSFEEPIFSQEPLTQQSQSRWVTQYSQGPTQCSQGPYHFSQEPTQVEPEAKETRNMSEMSLQLRNSLTETRSMSSRTTGRSVRNSDHVSLFGQASRMSVKTRRETTKLSNIDIQSLILNQKPLHLSIETYSYASSSRLPLRWRHMGLASDLCLSLIPSDHNNHPIVLLSRGTTSLESFVPYVGHLRAFFTNEILALKQLGGGTTPDKYIQMHMKQANIAATCEWLSYYNVQAEDPLDTTPFTEATTMRPVSKRRDLGSEVSFGSRQSRFWARRLKLCAK